MGRIGLACTLRNSLLNLAVGLALLALSPQMAVALSQLQGGADPLLRIKALRDGGNLPEALEAATAALRAEPGRRDLRMELGFLLGALGRHQEALAEYQAVLAEHPGDVEALLEHAQVKTLQRRYDEAEGEFRFVLAMATGLPGAAFGLGDVLTWKGDLAGARAAYLEYVRARPDDPRGHLRLGNVAAQAGDAAEAAARFREALRLDPASAEARVGLARAEGAAAREYRFRFEIGSTYETLTRGEPDWRQGAMLLRYRPWAGTEFNVGAQAFHRFGENDQLVTLGFEQGFFRVDGDQRLLSLSGQFSQSLNNGRLLPKQIYEGQLAVRTAPWLQLFTGYAFSDFAGNLTAGTVSPGSTMPTGAARSPSVRPGAWGCRTSGACSG